MSMHSPHESFTDILKGIWQNNRPLALAALFGVGIVLFIIWQKNNAASSAPMPVAAAPSSPMGRTGTTVNNFYETFMHHRTPKTPPPPPGIYPGPPIQPPGPIQPPPPGPPPGPVQTIFPAPKGSLHPSPPGAGNNDTNWFPAIVPQRMTLQQAAMQMANWGSSSMLYNYRNNAAIFRQMGVANQPNAMVIPGWSISV